MITWVRTAEIQQAKQIPAVEWALKVASYVSENQGVEVTVQGNVTGQINQIHWVVNFDSLADLEKLMMGIVPDEGYQALLAEAGEQELFFAGSVDNIYRSLP